MINRTQDLFRPKLNISFQNLKEKKIVYKFEDIAYTEKHVGFVIGLEDNLDKYFDTL